MPIRRAYSVIVYVCVRARARACVRVRPCVCVSQKYQVVFPGDATVYRFPNWDALCEEFKRYASSHAYIISSSKRSLTST